MDGPSPSANGIPEISEEQLRNLSIKRLNELLKQFPKEVEAELKSRRRILKNRGYATNTREKIGQQATQDQKRRLAQKERQLTAVKQKKTLLERHLKKTAKKK